MLRPLIVILSALLLSACGVSSLTPVASTNNPGQGGSPRYSAMPGSGRVTVQPGDTVYALSRRYGVPLREIIELNNLSAPYLLSPGQVIALPGPREYRVRSGDTVSEIAHAHGVNMSTLARANGLKPPYLIRVGQVLRLPGAPARAGGQPSVKVQTQTDTRTASGPPLPKPRPGQNTSAPKTTVSTVMTAQPKPKGRSAVRKYTPPPRSGRNFVWPVRGRILSSFGGKEGGLYNDGINISAKKGTPIKAAENGVVAYSGNELRGFGNLLLIKHADGWTTAYAHASKFNVRRGDRVKRGQVIGSVGDTGNVTSAQLHFEIRRGQKAVNPKKHLAGRPGSVQGLALLSRQVLNELPGNPA